MISGDVHTQFHPCRDPLERPSRSGLHGSMATQHHVEIADLCLFVIYTWLHLIIVPGKSPLYTTEDSKFTSTATTLSVLYPAVSAVLVDSAIYQTSSGDSSDEPKRRAVIVRINPVKLI